MKPVSAMIGEVGITAWAVLCVLAYEREPRSLSFIRAITDLSDKTVHAAIARLEVLGLVTQVGRYTYRITAGAVQLPLVAPELPVGEEPVETRSENFRPATLASSRFTESNQEEIPLLASKRESEKIRLEPPPEVMQALQEADIREPARSRLARLPHVTAALVQYHARTCANRGQAIYRIQHNWPVERRERDGPDDRRRYIEGDFAEFIEH